MRVRLGIALVISIVAASALWFVTQRKRFPARARQPANPATTESLTKLSRRGSVAVPEIIERLRSGNDENLTWPETLHRDASYREFPTLRTALIALLGDVGGDEATEYMRELVQTATEPLELALAAKFLEERFPGQYREEIVAAARKLLRESSADATPTLQLLALYGGREAVGDVETYAREHPAQADAAVSALVLLRHDGGDVALVGLWQRPNLARDTRAHLAQAIGAAAPDCPVARDAVRPIVTGNDPELRRRALEGLANGESYLDERLLPRKLVAMGRPHSDWLATRLVILESLQEGTAGDAHDQIQKVRDEMIEELERTQ